MDERKRRAELRRKLFALLKERAFRRGRVVLASGRESDYYFDMKPAMLDPDGANLLAELILQYIQDVKADCVGGLEMGAVPLIAPVAMRSLDFGRRLPGFFVRKAVKDHGTKKRVDGADIYYYLEADRLIGDCPINSAWMEQAFGPEVLRRTASHRISCAGTLIATPAITDP